MRVTSKTDHFGQTSEVEIIFGGDSELSNFIKALRWTLTTLKTLSQEGGYK